MKILLFIFLPFLLYSQDFTEYEHTRTDGIYIVSGILRNTGSGFYWIEDIGHEKLNFTSVVITSTTSIIVDYPKAAKVIYFSVVPDETYNRYIAGASVGYSNAVISIKDTNGTAVDPTLLTNMSGNFFVYGIFRK